MSARKARPKCRDCGKRIEGRRRGVARADIDPAALAKMLSEKGRLLREFQGQVQYRQVHTSCARPGN